MIHKFKARDLNILLDVNNGGVHLIDDVTYDIIDAIEPYFQEMGSDAPTAKEGSTCPEEIIEQFKDKYTREEICESFEEVRGLAAEDLLFKRSIWKIC